MAISNITLFGVSIIVFYTLTQILKFYGVGEEVYEEVDVRNFGRRAILAAKQTLAARIGDLKKNNLLKKYADRIGDIIGGEVYQIWKKEILLLDDEGNEFILPKENTKFHIELCKAWKS
mgnify:CR=1 FL=1